MAGSLADAEPAEDPVQDVVGHDGADNLPELVHRQPQVKRDQLITAAIDHDCCGRARAADARVRLPRHRAPVPAGADSRPSRARSRSAIAARRSATPSPVSALVTIKCSLAITPESGVARSALVQTTMRSTRAPAREPVSHIVSALRQSSSKSAPRRLRVAQGLGLAADAVGGHVESRGIHQLDEKPVAVASLDDVVARRPGLRRDDRSIPAQESVEEPALTRVRLSDEHHSRKFEIPVALRKLLRDRD